MKPLQARERRIPEVTLSEFIVLDDGLLTDKKAHELAGWYAANTPIKDPLALEANSILIRVGNTMFELGRPRNPPMSYARYQVLRNLYMSDKNRLSMSDISQLLDVTMTNVTKLIDGLVAAGHVRRVEDTDDKRKTWAQLTPDGMGFVAEMLPQVAMQIEKNWSILSSQEKKMLIHILSKMRLQLQIAGASEKLAATDKFENPAP